jgi:DnaJ-class molecular chaperone
VFGTAFGGLNEPKATKLSDVKVELSVTLKEFYSGSKKTVRYDRQVLGLDGRTVTTETTEI